MTFIEENIFIEQSAVGKIVNAFLQTSCLLTEASPKDISISTLKGGKSSSTLYKIDTGKISYVLRCPAPTTSNPNRWLQASLAKQAGVLGVGPKIHFVDSEEYAIIMEYVSGRTASPLDFENKSFLINFSLLLQKLHDSQLEFPLATCPFYRFQRFLIKCDQNKVYCDANFSDVKFIMDEIATILQLHPISLAPCHLDLNLSNIIFTNEKFLLVDWVNGGMSDPYFDLATFSIFAGLNESQTKDFLAYYLKHVPTQLEWARFVIIRPVRLFVIAASCFSASSTERTLNTENILEFSDFIHKNRDDLDVNQIGLAVFKKGLDLIQESFFRNSLNYLKNSANHP
ncbi:MAG TPA: phosphotransferase [Gammaproteobacteria bacterium]|nr:phosphotransferase [Gammaproteobacteria bacterium]